VPVGGMGRLVEALVARGRALGVTYLTQARVVRVAAGVQPAAGRATSTVIYQQDERELAVDGRWVLFNCAADVANRCLPGTWPEPALDGSVFKINMLLKRLPAVRGPHVSVREAFSGTLHMHEGYQHMQASYHAARQGQRLAALPGEMYCHSLTDPTILAPGLQAQGYQTLTLFGLDVPYDWFRADPEGVKDELTHSYLSGIEELVADDFRGCLAQDADGEPCLEARSPLDLEHSLGLPRGNIFHGSLDWPFSDDEAQAGTWGVATPHPRILMCGSSALRGGAVSGLPGYYAARHIFEVDH
jgi:phytoene dehydrogenase-like protein